MKQRYARVVTCSLAALVIGVAPAAAQQDQKNEAQGQSTTQDSPSANKDASGSSDAPSGSITVKPDCPPAAGATTGTNRNDTPSASPRTDGDKDQMQDKGDKQETDNARETRDKKY